MSNLLQNINTNIYRSEENEKGNHFLEICENGHWKNTDIELSSTDMRKVISALNSVNSKTTKNGYRISAIQRFDKDEDNKWVKDTSLLIQEKTVENDGSSYWKTANFDPIAIPRNPAAEDIMNAISMASQNIKSVRKNLVDKSVSALSGFSGKLSDMFGQGKNEKEQSSQIRKTRFDDYNDILEVFDGSEWKSTGIKHSPKNLKISMVGFDIVNSKAEKTGIRLSPRINKKYDEKLKDTVIETSFQVQRKSPDANGIRKWEDVDSLKPSIIPQNPTPMDIRKTLEDAGQKVNQIIKLQNSKNQEFELA